MHENDTTSYLENLPDNSHAARKERQEKQPEPKRAAEGKRVEKVVKGKVKTKKNEVRKLTDIFISEDVGNVKNYILMDVLVPTFKKTLYDIVVNSVDIALFGGRGSGSKRSTADKVSYTNYSSSSRRDERSSHRTTSGYSYDDIILESRAEAEAVLSRMDEIMEEYDVVRVADLYDLVGVTGEHTDNKYGWTNIRNAEVERVRDGYRIKMPRALPIHR